MKQLTIVSYETVKTIHAALMTAALSRGANAQFRGKLFVLLYANNDSEHAAEFALVALLIGNLMVALIL